MTLWSRLKNFFGGRVTNSDPDDVFSGVRWVSASENPFGVDLLDCRAFSQSMIATTQDPNIAMSYNALRASNGDQHRDRVPEDSTTHDCQLTYAHDGETADGPIFKADAMEDKWDIYLYDDYLYFARSWRGELKYRAKILFEHDCARVVAVTAPQDPDPHYPVAVVDYLIRSHIYGQPIPHPLPASLGRDPEELALFSFSSYGRHGLYGTFADTTELQPPPSEEA